MDISSELYDRLMRLWLQDNNIDMYSISNEGKSVVAENTIGTLIVIYALNFKKCIYWQKR